MNGKVIRLCPKCGKELYYATKKSAKVADKNGTLCKDCKNPKLDKYVRLCPQCGKEKVYKTQHSFNQSDPSKLCRSCISATVMKGKTVYGQWILKYGKEEADARLLASKIKMGNSRKGEKNPNYKNKSNGAKVLAEIGHNCKGKTLEEIHGKEKSEIIKKKLSKAFSGKNNPMYGKPAPQGSGNGWSGHYLGYYFRSLLELSYLKHLIDNNINFENGEKRKYSIEYKLGETDRTYHPDYYLIDNQEIIEIKPKNLINSYENKAKFKAAKQKYGNDFIIITEEQIKKLSFLQIQGLYSERILIFDKRYERKFIEYMKMEGNKQ